MINKQKKIVVKLVGGLGNQLFQYFFGKKYQENKNFELYFDDKWFQDAKKQHEKNRLDELGLKWTSADQLNIDKWFLYRNRFIKRLRIPRKLDYFNEKNLSNFNPHKIKNGAYFDGFWQQEEIYNSQREKIINELITALDVKFNFVKLPQNFEIQKCASVHVRRGDYLTSKFHNSQSIKYYIHSMDKLHELMKVDTFFIFSDEPGWLESCLKEKKYNVINGSFIAKNYDLAEFNLMRQFHNHIISSSSFSWWAAWIGSFKRHSIVCYPNDLKHDLKVKNNYSKWICIEDI
jgi:hypothetical protein